MNNLPPPYTPAEERAAFTRLANGCPHARGEIVERNLRLVISRVEHIIKRSPMVGYDDLIQEGSIGLMHAVDRFDPSRGHKFSTYATYWIDQALWRCLHSSDHIRLPVHVGERVAMVRRYADAMDSPTIESVTAALKADGHAITRNTVAAIIGPVGAQPLSLYARRGDGDGSNLIEQIEVLDDFAEAIADADERRTMREDIEVMLAHLTPWQAQAIRLHYGLDGEPMTYQQIADTMGMTRQNANHAVLAGKRKLQGRR